MMANENTTCTLLVGHLPINICRVRNILTFTVRKNMADVKNILKPKKHVTNISACKLKRLYFWLSWGAI